MNNKLYDCSADATCYGIHRYEEIYMSHTIDRAEILDCVHGRRLKARGIAVDDHGKVRMPGGSLAQVGRLKLIAGGVPKEPEAPGGRGRITRKRRITSREPCTCGCFHCDPLQPIPKTQERHAAGLCMGCGHKKCTCRRRKSNSKPFQIPGKQSKAGERTR